MSVLRDIAEVVHAAEERLSRVALAEVMTGRKALGADGGPAPVQKSHLGLGRQRAHPEQVRAMFEEVAGTIAALPAAFREAARAPYQTIARQRDRLAARLESGERLERDEIVKFKELIARTLDAYLNESNAHQRHQREIHARLETALNDVLLYQHLAPAPQRSAMDALRYQLTTLLANGDVRLGQVELIENRLAGLKHEIDSKVVNTAHRKGLCESITRNLSEMGYEALAEFPSDVEGEALEACMRIPGGEQVRIALQADNQVSFAIAHERPHGAGKFSKAELNHIRKQEERWCGDFKELVRRLVSEGFSYQIGIEQAIPEQSIKVVVVETAEEILEEDARYQEQEKKRYLG
jgi:hypothetical protein